MVVWSCLWYLVPENDNDNDQDQDLDDELMMVVCIERIYSINCITTKSRNFDQISNFFRLTMATVNKEEVKPIKNIISIQNLILKQKPPVEHTGLKKTLLITKSKIF